jgi:nitrate reductase gamma subunit
MRGIITLMIALVALVLLTSPSEGSWLIDARRFHISAHGRSSCIDCHGDDSRRAIHPDPTVVNRDLSSFFRLGQCGSCHADVIERLKSGFHGSAEISNGEAYLLCIECHDPHYQYSITDFTGHFDLPWLRGRQCSACHEYREALPSFRARDKNCMSCHRYTEDDGQEGVERLSRFCFNCHGRFRGDEDRISGQSPIIDFSGYQSTPHARLSCLKCHPDSAGFQHANQIRRDCRICHSPHRQEVAHDVHLQVSCEACHLRDAVPFRDPASRIILWRIDRKSDVSVVHDLVRPSEKNFCQRCHFRGNSLGAASAVLPAKSITCMPCHAANFSVRDVASLVSLIIFMLGIILHISVWVSGSIMNRGEEITGLRPRRFRAAIEHIFPSRVFIVIKALLLDALLQRRLYRQSRTRWIIHGLIFFPFVFRFSWGLVALISSSWIPQSQMAWNMLDRNYPAGAILFDLTGVMVILGILLASIRKVLRRSENPPGLPKQDWLAFGLITGIVVIGFVLEGMRIAMTGYPDGSEYAFLGFVISLLMKGFSGLTDSYGYLWYAHAILTGAFVAYLPFSRMFHLVMAPVVLAMNAVSRYTSEGIGLLNNKHTGKS